LPSDEVILEALTSPDKPLDDLHHISYFFIKLRRIEVGELVLTVNGDRSCPINPLDTHAVCAKGNMVSIDEMIPIYIYIEPLLLWRMFLSEWNAPLKTFEFI
jgi:hypothetical protein